LGDERPSKDAGLHKPPRVDLSENYERSRPILTAMARAVPNEDAFVAILDKDGFPACQSVIRRPVDLPAALVIGRHNRCALSVAKDPRVSLRHLLLTIWPGRGPLRMRGYDLGGRGGVLLADGKRVPGFSAHGQIALTLGASAMYVLPGGEEGVSLLEGTFEESYRALTGLLPDGKGHRLAVSAMVRPGVAQLGGYRPVDVDVPPESRGRLTLRNTKRAQAPEETKDLEVDDDQLGRGLLIGRYSDRCSLAGQGRNLSRVHALVAEETAESLLVYDLASTNGVRPQGITDGPSHAVVRLCATDPCMLGHFELAWTPGVRPTLH